jgi:dTDP-glucose 4,6-dehydratase
MEHKKTFFITGGCGFIGSHFVEKVLSQGHRVVNVDKLTYAANDIEFVGDYSFIKEDITKLKEIPACDYVINFAAESHVDNSIEASQEFLRTNIEGCHNLLEILKNNKISSMQKAWEYKLPLFVQISTDEVFGDKEQGEGFAENDRHKPSNPYSASKSAAEQLVVAWGRTYDIPYIITRTTNNYGPRQHEEKLIPRCITNLMNDKKIPIHGSGEYVRNWIHVDDNVEAILTILEKGRRNQSYHIASDEEYSVKEIATIIAAKFGKTFKEVSDMSGDRSGADVRYALKFNRLKKLGWKQTRHLDESLDQIIQHYKNQKT